MLSKWAPVRSFYTKAKEAHKIPMLAINLDSAKPRNSLHYRKLVSKFTSKPFPNARMEFTAVYKTAAFPSISH